jgi:hypothetical protein
MVSSLAISTLVGVNEDFELKELIDEKLLYKLDTLDFNKGCYKRYAEMYQGGVAALKKENRDDNLDWMSQSANSFREIIYVLKRSLDYEKEINEMLSDLFSKSSVKNEVGNNVKYLNGIYTFFTDLTHHFSKITPTDGSYQIAKKYSLKVDKDYILTIENYLKVIRYYKLYLEKLALTSIELHKKIKV